MRRRKCQGQTDITFDVLAELLGLSKEMEVKDILIDPTRERVSVIYRSEEPVISKVSNARTFDVGTLQEVIKNDIITSANQFTHLKIME